METKDAIKPNTETTTETIEEKVEVPKKSKSLNETQRRIHDIIFEADTFGGKVFDIALLVCISLSVLTTALDSVETLHSQYQQLFVLVSAASTSSVISPNSHFLGFSIAFTHSVPFLIEN